MEKLTVTITEYIPSKIQSFTTKGIKPIIMRRGMVSKKILSVFDRFMG
jgi:hypothetical protein